MTDEDLDRIRIARDANKDGQMSRLDKFAMAALSGLLAKPGIAATPDVVITLAFDYAERALQESRSRIGQ